MSQAEVIIRSYTIGATLRKVLLETHYTSPPVLSDHTILQNSIELQNWCLSAQPNDDGPEPEVLDAWNDDFDTPKILTFARQSFQDGNFKQLFATLNFLGFFNQGHTTPYPLTRVPPDVAARLGYSADPLQTEHAVKHRCI